MFFQVQYRGDRECRVFSAIRFREVDPAKLAADTGIMAHVVQDFQKAIRRKRDSAVIEI